MARTRWITAGEIECSKADGSTCMLHRQKQQFFVQTLDSDDSWADNGYERLTLSGSHVKELSDGRLQVVATGEILTRVGKAK